MFQLKALSEQHTHKTYTHKPILPTNHTSYIYQQPPHTYFHFPRTHHPALPRSPVLPSSLLSLLHFLPCPSPSLFSVRCSLSPSRRSTMNFSSASWPVYPMPPALELLIVRIASSFKPSFTSSSKQVPISKMFLPIRFSFTIVQQSPIVRL